MTFNSNGGTGAMANEANNVADRLDHQHLYPRGFTFAGWNRLPVVVGTAYADGAATLHR